MLATRIMSKYGDSLSREDFIKTVLLLLNAPLPKLKLILDDALKPASDIPYWIALVVKAILVDLQKSSATKTFHLLDMCFGTKPTRKTSIYQVNTNLNIDTLTKDERATLRALQAKIKR